MNQAVVTETGWRGSREGWLDAAYLALMEGGIDAVKILPLAKGLGLSRTSFYWFFDSREALLDALIDRWAGRTTAPLLAATTEYAETLTEAMLNVLVCFLTDGFDSRLEYALRSWALQDENVALRVQAADAARLAALCDMLTQWGIDADAADVRAHTIYLTQIGYISMRTQENMAERLKRIPNYVEIYTSQRARPGEIARFAARLNGSTKPPMQERVT